MASNDILTRILLEGAEVVKKQLDEIGRNGSKSLDSIDAAGKKASTGIAAADKAITRASVSFVTAQTNISKMGTALVDVGSSFTRLAATLGKFSLAVTGVVAALAPVGVALFSLAKSAANTTDEIRDAAIAAGTAAQTFAELGFAASQSGSDAGQLSRGLSVIADATNQAIEAGTRSHGAFQRLGVALVDAQGNARDTGDVFLDVADKIAAIDNPTKRTTTTIDLFGRRIGPSLVQTLQEGSSGLSKFAKEAAKLGIVFTKAELKIGEEFNDAVDALTSSLTGLRTAMGLALAAEFLPTVKSITEAVKSAIPFFRELGKSIGEQLAVAFTAIGAVIENVLVPAFNTVVGALQLFLDALNALLGTDFSLADMVAFVGLLTALALAITAVIAITGGFMAAMFSLGALIGALIAPFLAIGTLIGTIGGAFLALAEIAAVVIAAINPISVAIIAVGIAIGVLVGWLLTLDWEPLTTGAIDAWNAVLEAAQSAIDGVIAGWNAAMSAVAQIWEGLKSTAATVWEGVKTVFAEGIKAINALWATVKQAAQDAWNGVKAVAVSALSEIRSAIQGVIDFLQQMYDAAVEAANAIARALGAGGSGGGEGEGRASGGAIRGPGSGTSDSIPAWLSDGEWVIKAAAVKKYGHRLFAALNSMAIPASALRRLLGHAGGGPVNVDLGSAFRSFAPLRMAEGGVAGAAAGQTLKLDLILAGEAFEGLMAPRETADRLIRFAMSEQVKSGGRKPTWYR